MRVLVRIATAHGRFALPVEATRGVLPAEELRPLPSPRPGVVGLADHLGAALPVLAAFGDGGEHVLVVETDGTRFGLLVEEVSGVARVRDDEVAPAPAGQDEPLVAGILGRGDDQVLVLDPGTLRRRLG